MKTKFEIQTSIMSIKKELVDILKQTDLVGSSFDGNGISELPMSYTIVNQEGDEITVEDEFESPFDLTLIELDIETLLQLL